MSKKQRKSNTQSQSASLKLDNLMDSLNNDSLYVVDY
jgi:hypothetical protein